MYLIWASTAIAAAIVALFALLEIVTPDAAGIAWGVVTFLLAIVASFAVLGRTMTRGMTAELTKAEKALQNRNTTLAIKILEETLTKYGPWHPLAKAQVHSQIGQIYYIENKVSEAIPHLRQALRWDWVAQTMLACALHKKKKEDEMEKIFETVARTRTARKEPLFWTIYAFVSRKESKAKAEEILQRGLKFNAEDKRLQSSLHAVRAGRRMKTNVYGPQWLQFRL